jgi:lysophospholipase L1-like esterase
MPGRVRRFLARTGGATLIVFGLALGPAVGDGLRSDALPLPSAAPRVDPEPLAPTRLDCQRLAPANPVPRPPAPFGAAVLADRGGQAMLKFYAALSEAAAGRGIARIMYFGDSHVASDLMTGRIRHNLQSRFGDGGVGFVLPTKPLRWYGHADVEIGKGVGWDVLAVRKAHDIERRVGPSGFALIAHNTASASIRLRTSDMGIKRRARLQVFYLQQPAGGRARIVLDGQEVKTWSTSSEGMAELSGYYESTLRRMPETIEVNALGDGPVTLYGLTLERSGAGVVLDTLGIPGARAKDQLLTDDEMYREHLIKREPNLVVLSYGTNEGTDTGEPMDLFEEHLRHVIGRVKEAVPGASCLIVGPTDHPLRVGRGYRVRKRTAQIIDAERRIAGENSCGFIDLVSVMGGPMSMMRMVADHFAGPDHTHFTRRGYEALADAISGAMVNGWNTWQKSSCVQERRAETKATSP